MSDESITIQLKLSAEEIAMLADESENTESSELGEFFGKVLRLADERAVSLAETIKKVNEANPYSKRHKEEEIEEL